MKTNPGVFLMVISAILLTGCNEKETRISRMCSCMQKKRDTSNNELNEVFGNNITTVLANAQALDCAQQVQNEDNLTYTEMIGLFQEFTKSPYAKQYGIDAASLDEATQNLKEELKNGADNMDEETRPGPDTLPQYVSPDTANIPPPTSADTLLLK